MIASTHADLKVSDRAFAFLKLQRGRINDLAPNRGKWLAAYNAALIDLYQNIAPHLPVKCDNVLDIGSGLGGIDVLINRHYPAGVSVSLLDGEADEPRLILHRKTFNDMTVAREFQHANGVVDVSYFTPDVTSAESRPFDLIVSFGSWCFHYPPAVYLPFVLGCVKRGETALILEVRKDKPDWLADLEAAFGKSKVIFERPKFERLVFKP